MWFLWTSMEMCATSSFKRDLALTTSWRSCLNTTNSLYLRLVFRSMRILWWTKWTCRATAQCVCSESIALTLMACSPKTWARSAETWKMQSFWITRLLRICCSLNVQCQLSLGMKTPRIDNSTTLFRFSFSYLRFMIAERQSLELSRTTLSISHGLNKCAMHS